MAGGAIYAVTTMASGREFNGSDFGAAVAVGAVGGALIGSGVGAGAGIAAFAAVGAGTGIIGSQLGYSIASGTNYDTGEMVIAAAVGGATGALTGGVNGSSLAGTATAYGINVAANGAANTVQYAATQLYNGEAIDPSTAALSAAQGATVTALIDLPGQLFSPRYSPHDARYWSMVQQGRFIRPDVLSTARSIARQRLVGGTLTATVRNTLEYGLAQAQ